MGNTNACSPASVEDIDADANLLRPVGSRVRTVHVDLYTEAAKKVTVWRDRALAAEKEIQRLQRQIEDNNLDLLVARKKEEETTHVKAAALQEIQAMHQVTKAVKDDLHYGGETNLRAKQLELKLHISDIDVERQLRRADACEADAENERNRRLVEEERTAELEATLRTFQQLACPECRLRADEMLAARDFYAKLGARQRNFPLQAVRPRSGETPTKASKPPR
jgi:hypothetical protein